MIHWERYTLVETKWWAGSLSILEQWTGASNPLWVHCLKHEVSWTWPLAVSPKVVLLRYPDSWYRDITSNKKFFSLAATYRGTIVGMIVAEIKSRTKIHKEVSMYGGDGAARPLGQNHAACSVALSLSLRSPDHVWDSDPGGFFLCVCNTVICTLSNTS